MNSIFASPDTQSCIVHERKDTADNTSILIVNDTTKPDQVSVDSRLLLKITTIALVVLCSNLSVLLVQPHIV